MSIKFSRFECDALSWRRPAGICSNGTCTLTGGRTVMASPGDGGTAGDVRGRTVWELMEILERQEKILSNPKFIARLPDRGKKILDYTEKVRAAILEHKRLEKTTNLLSKFKLEFEETQNDVKEKSLTANQRTLSLPAETLHNKSSKNTDSVSDINNRPNAGAMVTSSEAECKTNMDKENPSMPGENSSQTENKSFKNSLRENTKYNVDTSVSPFTADTVSETNHKSNIDAGRPLVREDKNQKPAINNASTADDLVDGLKEISITDSTERGSDGPKTSNHPKNPSHPITKQSHYLEVIQKRARSPVHQKEKFRTNRLPSDSDSSTPNQSPGEKALRLSAEQRRAQDRKHLDDITAAKFPPLHHSPALLLPLEESLNLQIEQNKSYEETQAKLAARKLFEKLNIKMETFNPEGDSYMKYRDQRDDEGCDAEE